MPKLPLHLQIENTVHRDGEELTAALQARDSLQGAVAKAERGSVRAPTPDPTSVTRRSRLTRSPAKCQGDSCLGRVFWWGQYLNKVP